MPADVRQEILLDDDQLNDELDQVTDTQTEELAWAALAKLPERIPKPWLFINRFSRFVIDPERFPDEREPMNKVGMGAVYTQTTSGAMLREPNFDRKSLMERFFDPYAQAFSTLVDEILHANGRLTIADLHSYRAEQHVNAVNHGQARPATCIGTDSFHTPSWLRDIFFEEFGAIGDTVENQPYSGSYVPIAHYSVDSRVRSIMMEARADTFLDSQLRAHEGFDLRSQALSRAILAISDKDPQVSRP
jgi:N-formylglutamate amidohydrolase